MRIVSWNCCCGFFGKKLETITSKEFNADILVIPECREMDMKGSGYDEKYHDWYGDHKEAMDTLGNINKEKDLGIGVFWKDDIVITQLPDWEKSWSKESNFRYLVPYSVKSVKGIFEQFTLITVWTKNKMDASDPLDYIQKAHAAVDHYKSIGLLDGRVILIGDFNSNAIWDNRYREECNHSALVKKFEQLGIKDCSNSLTKDEFNTYYYYKKKEYRVIIDYCFASDELIKSATFIPPNPSDWEEKNGIKRWRGLSDHCPIIVDFDL